MRYLATALFAATVVLALSGAQPTAQPGDITGTWTAELGDGRVYLQLQTTPPDDWRHGGDWRGGWNTGQTMPVEDLPGLPANDPRFTVSQIRLELRREAGTIAMDGAFRDGRGAGLFRFTPRPEFTAEMKAVGYSEDLPLWRRFQFAAHDVGPRYIRALRAEGYDTLTLDEIQRARTHGVTADYIKAMKAEGYTVSTLQDIVRTRDHGVTPEYVKAMRAAGFKDASLDDLLRAKDHGVNAEFVAGMRGAGFKDATLADYVRARDHGVNPDYVRSLRAQGVSASTLDGVVRLRDHGVSAEYVEDMKGIGLKSLTAEDLVRLHDHGITPGFVNHVRAQGFKEDTPEGLIELKNRGAYRR
jgi:hypothetical protein